LILIDHNQISHLTGDQTIMPIEHRASTFKKGPRLTFIIFWVKGI
jgi:hypothetical protein